MRGGGYKGASAARANGPGRPRCSRWAPTPRRWCGQSTFSSIAPSTEKPSRSHRWSTNIPVSHCCIWRKLHHAERLVTELEKDFATAGGPPMVLRMDNGPELVSQALQRFCGDRIGMSYIPPGTWNNGYIELWGQWLQQRWIRGSFDPNQVPRLRFTGVAVCVVRRHLRRPSQACYRCLRASKAWRRSINRIAQCS